MKPTFPFSRFALIAIASLFLSLPAAAQEKKLTARDVPAAVIAAFKTAYPNATIRGYAREKENGKVYYTAHYVTNDGNRHWLTVNENGTTRIGSAYVLTTPPSGWKVVGPR